MDRPSREQIAEARNHAVKLLQFYNEYGFDESDDAKCLRTLLAATAEPSEQELAEESAGWYDTNRGIIRAQSPKQNILHAYECGARREGAR